MLEADPIGYSERALLPALILSMPPIVASPKQRRKTGADYA